MIGRVNEYRQSSFQNDQNRSSLVTNYPVSSGQGSELDDDELEYQMAPYANQDRMSHPHSMSDEDENNDEDDF